MSLIVTDYNKNIVKDSSIDGFIINGIYSVYPDASSICVDVVEAASVIHLHNRIVILNCDKIIDEEELPDLKLYLYKYIEYVDYIIYSDYSILNICSSYANKLIYDSKTLVNSYCELNSLETKAFISSELTYEEVSDIINNTIEGKLCINVFGLHQIMYSKRKLLSLYNEYYKVDAIETNKMYHLKEELRDELYNVIETNNGTFIYAPYIMAYKRKLEGISKVFMFRVNSYGLSSSVIKKVCSLYKDYSEGKPIEFDDIINVKEGFLVDKLFLLKGECE